MPPKLRLSPNFKSTDFADYNECRISNLEPVNACDALCIGKIVIRQHYTGIRYSKKSLTDIVKNTNKMKITKIPSSKKQISTK